MILIVVLILMLVGAHCPLGLKADGGITSQAAG